MNPLKHQHRVPEYLSPSALMCFEGDSVEYYRRYLTPVKAPKMLQTQPMSVGSAFDAYVKSHLHDRILGKNHPEAAKYSLEALLTSQVEPHNLEWARKAGKHCFDMYSESGALADLMLELNKSVDDPRFEFELRGTVEGHREGVTAQKMGVVLLGKPDLQYLNSVGAQIVFDWKVNGYCGKANKSPMAGYVMCREYNGLHYIRKGAHKDALVQTYKGLNINVTSYLENYDADWALQLSTYNWLLGAPVGKEIIASVDQICGNGTKTDSQGRPYLRFASHRLRISEKFQFDAMARYQHLWNIIHSEPFYFFREMSYEDSLKRCESLDAECALMSDPTLTDDERWVMNMGRTQ